MGHGLEVSKMTGQVEMFYVRGENGEGTPWHRLGTPVPAELTGAEALKAAHLDWQVEKFPLYVHRPDVEGVLRAYEVPTHRSLFRTDTMEQLHVVGAGFEPIQNAELFAFGDALVGESAAMYHTAGALYGGKQVWALAKLPHNIVVVPGDEVEPFILIANGHDTCRRFICRLTSIRVVCANTLGMALAVPGAKFEMGLRHTSTIRDRAADARQALGMSLRYFEVLGQRFQALAAKQLTAMTLDGYIQAVFPLPERPEGDEATEESLKRFERATSRVETIQQRVAFLFENGRGNDLPRVKGTAWAAYNAVTEWVDHVRPVDAKGNLRPSSAQDTLFGAGNVIKSRAFAAALAL